MTRSFDTPARALATGGLTAVAATLGCLAAAPMAAAHVHVDAVDPTPGSSAILTFRVPGESETGAVTTEISVSLPGDSSARTELVPGWTARLDRNIEAGTVRSITWTADPGVGISSDQFAEFRVSVKLPDSDSASFPATQTYSDGTVVRWDQPPLPDGGEPEYPAPLLALDGDATGHANHSASAASTPTDSTSRWLGGAGLLLGAVGAGAGALALRRS